MLMIRNSLYDKWENKSNPCLYLLLLYHIITTDKDTDYACLAICHKDYYGLIKEIDSHL